MAEKLRLFEIYQAVLCDTAQRLQQEKTLAADELRSFIKEQLSQARQQCDTYYSLDELLQAEFAVCAYLDSYILSKNWSCKDQWRKNLLQDDYFNTTDAGVLFYEKCNVLTCEQPDLLHLYFNCLASGFRGQYYARTMNSSIQQAMQSLLDKLNPNDTDAGLLVRASNTPLIHQRFSRKKLVYLITAPLILFLLTYGCFYWVVAHGIRSYLTAAT